MNSKLALVAGLLLVGCAAESEQATQDTNEIVAAPVRLVGSFESKGLESAPPTFEQLVLRDDGQFFAEIDTGIRCITTPCPSHVSMFGTYSVTRTTLTLTAENQKEATGFDGVYSYKLSGDSLSLSRDKWSNTLGQIPSIWENNAKKIVARNSGGGFTPPPAPGSNCAVGASTYELDLASKKITWKECDFQGWDKPMTEISGVAAISNFQIEQIKNAAKSVTISRLEMCGADKPFLTVAVTTPSGTKEYTDSFYSCMQGDDVFVDNIDEMFSAFRAVLGH